MKWNIPKIKITKKRIFRINSLKNSIRIICMQITLVHFNISSPEKTLESKISINKMRGSKTRRSRKKLQKSFFILPKLERKKYRPKKNRIPRQNRKRKKYAG